MLFCQSNIAAGIWLSNISCKNLVVAMLLQTVTAALRNNKGVKSKGAEQTDSAAFMVLHGIPIPVRQLRRGLRGRPGWCLLCMHVILGLTELAAEVEGVTPVAVVLSSFVAVRLEGSSMSPVRQL
jgi:hypothetical protein